MGNSFFQDFFLPGGLDFSAELFLPVDFFLPETDPLASALLAQRSRVASVEIRWRAVARFPQFNQGTALRS